MPDWRLRAYPASGSVFVEKVLGFRLCLTQRVGGLLCVTGFHKLDNQHLETPVFAHQPQPPINRRLLTSSTRHYISGIASCTR